MSLRQTLRYLVLAWCSTACSRSCSPSEQQASGGAPSASVERPAPPLAPSTKAPPAPRPVTPDSPPQLVACEGLDFYRITEETLHVFRASKEIPPPNLRGSATASHSARIEVAEPLNVVALGKGSALVIGKRNVYRYQSGEKQAQASAPIPTPSPLFAWRAQGNGDSFWVRLLGESRVHRLTLPAAAGDSARSTPGALPSEAKTLPDFDDRLFAVLADGVPLYSTAKGLRTLESETAFSLPRLSQPVKLLFADVSPGRYWIADATGGLSLHERTRPEPPVLFARVPGVVIDSAIEGNRVAVLSMELEDQSYRPTVTIFSEGQKRGELEIGPSVAQYGPHRLDLCLIAGRPWVVVGGRHWLQLLDWSARRLLAEW